MLRGGAGDEVLGVRDALVVGRGVVVAHITAHFQEATLVLALVVHPREVATHLLGVGETTAPVVGVVGIAKEGHAPGIHEACHAEVAQIALLRTIGAFDIALPALAHSLLDGQVQHGLLFAVVDAGDAGVVALAVVGLDLTDHIGLNVLQRHLRVVAEELLLVDQDFLYLLAVDLDGALLGDFSAGELLQQRLEIGTGRDAEGVGIIYKGVGLHLHLRSLRRHQRLAHELRVVLQRDLSHGQLAVLLRDFDAAEHGLVAYERGTQQVAAHRDGGYGEGAVVARLLTCHLRAVQPHDDHGGTGHGFAF